ncbi:hypothetical protein HPB50_019022 [Hyalomma asiaticum]|uniref:Uncharacterized protein n=1 Tax=Hyalomma asiaticum TaxID=266040 RepID=A0ACB7T3P9_HYAAI|nr:hypothetical protein HPB50_019022 [Hyalomma asiaticum]
MLWNVTIHDLLDLPLPTGVTLQAYADDTVIVVPAQNREALAELGSRVLGQTPRHGKEPPSHPSHQRREESRVQRASIRVLGVVFDGMLSLREKAEVTVGKIAALAQMQGGRLRPEKKTYLYRSVFLPGVMYASPVWRDRTRPDCASGRASFYSEGRHAGTPGGVPHYSHGALQVLLNAPPIALELERAMPSMIKCPTNTRLVRRHFVYPNEIMPPVDVWQDHPAARMYYGYRRLTRDGARRLARAPGLHVYTDGSY